MWFHSLNFINQNNALFRLVLFVASLIPISLLYYDYSSKNLGFNPYETLSETTGQWALIFLLLSLAITPVRRWVCFLSKRLRLKYGKRLSDWNFLIKSRRMLGLYSFAYALCHGFVYVHFDADWDWPYFVEDIYDRNFLKYGLISLLLLVPLAITSFKRIQRSMGKNWRRLHRLSYLIGILSVLHFFSLSKVGDQEPFLYIVVLSILLGHRVFVRYWRTMQRSEDDGMEASR